MKCTLEKLKEIISYKRDGEFLVPRIECNDGLSLSVQVGRYSYCRPREDDADYTHAEVGFPSRKIKEFMPYAEDAQRPTETVYPYVPLEVILDVINKAGGIPVENLI